MLTMPEFDRVCSDLKISDRISRTEVDGSRLACTGGTTGFAVSRRAP